MSYVRRDWFRRPNGTRCRIPRFNLAFELGLAAAIAHFGQSDRSSDSPQHQFFVFERERYRLQASLSDLGVDPFIHDGTADGVTLAVLNAFSTHARSITPEFVKQVLSQLKRYYRSLKKTRGSIFEPYCFGSIVYLAAVILQQLRTH